MLGRGFQGARIILFFLGRSKSFPAPADIPNTRRQPHTQPHCLALGSRSQSQSTATPPHFPQNYNIPHPTPNFSHPHHKILAHATTYAPTMDCHQPYPLLMQTSQSPHQSQKTLMSPSLHIYKSF